MVRTCESYQPGNLRYGSYQVEFPGRNAVCTFPSNPAAITYFTQRNK
jgi:hypothetical protein